MTGRPFGQVNYPIPWALPRRLIKRCGAELVVPRRLIKRCGAELVVPRRLIKLLWQGLGVAEGLLDRG